MARPDHAPGGWCGTGPRHPASGEAFCWRTLIVAAAAVVMAGCAGLPKPGFSGGGRDGPMPVTPAGLDGVPDAEPRIEPLRAGGPNKPYEINGRRYAPEPRDVPLKERGLASWYGRKFHGRRTANGEVYDMFAVTAAHPTMPLPSYAVVRNPANGREIVVRVNDRGPFHPGRIIDLSYTAALKLDLLRGVAPVEVERLTHEAIRTGSWRRDTRMAVAQAPATMPPSTSAPVPVPATSVVPVAAPPASQRSSASSDRRADSDVALARPSPDTLPAPDAQTMQPHDGAAAAPGASATRPRDVVAPPPNGVTAAAPIDGQPSGFWIQLGVFRQIEGARSFHHQVAREVDWVAPLLAVFRDSDLHRLQAGPYASRDDAHAAADRLRQALQLVPVIVERR